MAFRLARPAWCWLHLQGWHRDIEKSRVGGRISTDFEPDYVLHALVACGIVQIGSLFRHPGAIFAPRMHMILGVAA